jgi:hypothetical protein
MFSLQLPSSRPTFAARLDTHLDGATRKFLGYVVRRMVQEQGWQRVESMKTTELTELLPVWVYGLESCRNLRTPS